uniref:Large ribosomal subunit protein bL20c n=1 Tax=Botrychium lunaria TaxID=37231 RepID=A0A6H0JQW6_BOTLU|nr:ribosomal protein L20 [Botrychium lunaria]QIU83314.1 ribosomal protein L20 [Botrychium lunaria]
MTRVKRGYVARRHRKNILALASGFRGAHSKLFRTANQQGMKALVYAYRDRANRKREIRRLWISRINAAARDNGITHNGTIHYLCKNQVRLNRKILAQMAIPDKDCYLSILESISG